MNTVGLGWIFFYPTLPCITEIFNPIELLKKYILVKKNGEKKHALLNVLFRNIFSSNPNHIGPKYLLIILSFVLNIRLDVLGSNKQRYFFNSIQAVCLRCLHSFK